MSDEDPKIIVDDDWKSQVEKEKEQLEKEAETTSATTEGDATQEMPPASFPMLISTLATQAMASMGMLPDPRTGEASAHKPMAKHFIDTLGILQEKTEGNLAEEEATMLRDTLHQLRMAYMAVPDTPTSAPEQPEEKKSSIELP
jgi:hypothetical protein